MFLRRTFALALCALVGCGGARKTAPPPAEVGSPPAPPAATPPDCAARAGQDGPCFPSAEAACRALACAPPTRCAFGYSMPEIVTCGARDEGMR